MKGKIANRLKTISLYGVSQILGVASVLLISLIIVTYHSTELWGHYAEILIWSNFILLFLNFGSHDFLLRTFSKDPAAAAQNWITNFLTRSLLVLPAAAIVFIVPMFRGVEFLMLALIGVQFVSASFKVLVLFHRDFTVNIWIEVIYNVLVVCALFFFMDSLDVRSLLLIIILGQSLKTLCFCVFYRNTFRKVKLSINLRGLWLSFPFFVPIAVGTIRVKVDAYYGTYFFSVNDLSKYQIFLSFLMLAQMAGPFILNPYLKNFYRSGNALVRKLHEQFFAYGWLFAILMTAVMYVAITYVYQLEFTMKQYLFAFLFMVPLMVHTTLVNEYYKRNKQVNIAIFSSILIGFQIVIGYFLIQSRGIDGALILKILGQWSIVIVLWLWIRKRRDTHKPQVA